MIPQQAMMQNALSPHTPSPLPAEADETVIGTDIVYLADLHPQPVEWLWEHRLAAGTLAMFSGEPGSGKTWVALAIAAALTRGRDPFTGETLKPATVLYASAEHAASQVIQPRFAALHGDPARLVVLRRAVSVSSKSSPDSALHDLEDALQKTRAHLVILDPWDGLLGPQADLDRASETRPLLDRLGRLAELHRCCILLIRHLAKPEVRRSVRRGRASMECSAALRTEFLVGSSPTHPRKPLCCTSNQTSGRWLCRSITGSEKPAISTGRGSAISPRANSSPPVPPEPVCPSASLPPNGCVTACSLAARPRAPSRLPPSATVSASPPCAAPNSISAFVASKTENRVPGGGLCRRWRISTSGQRGKMLNELLEHLEHLHKTNDLELKKSRGQEDVRAIRFRGQEDGKKTTDCGTLR